LGRPLVFGHRGASARAADNTLEAFAVARDQGADGIEFDVRLTKDNVMIIHHDDAVRGLGPFRRKRFSEIRDKAPSVPTIDEVLEVSGDMYLNAEIKNSPKDKDHDPRHRTTRVLADWAQENNVESRILVTSFNGETTDQMRFVDRNVAMAKRLDALARDPKRAGQDVFVVVGAAHFVGEDDIRSMLAAKGLRVRTIRTGEAPGDTRSERRGDDER